MDKVLKFLFRNAPEGSKPQLGWADRTKVGKLWLPGKGAAKPGEITRFMQLPYRGCTQLVFENWWNAAGSQTCWVCWVGLDIDSDDNPEINLVKWAKKFVAANPTSMVRLSCGGSGLHMIWVLKEPIQTNNHGAGMIVKNIAAKYKRLAEADGIHVCQANRRMFWLDGGKNQTIYESDFMLELEEVITESMEVSRSNELMDISPSIQRYIDQLAERRVFRSQIGKSNPVYVGDAVAALRDIGERVDTVSRMRGNGQVNGYIDIEGHRISLWSYADGHVIWNYDDVGAML